MSIKSLIKIKPTAIELFEKRAKKNPYGIAAIYENKVLTYRELDRKSNQLAHFLHKSGVQSETLVGVSLSNSLELIVGILGVLKAGGTYVPVEPNYPLERIEYMLEDSKPSILLTDSTHVSQFKNFLGKLIQLDTTWKEIATLSEKKLKIPILPNHLAYVIYTSGSTGRPKGIMVEHGSFAHGAAAHRKFYRGKLVGLLTSAISFDVSILIIFHLLISGGTVCIPPSESLMDAVKLINLIESNSVSYILCVPSLYSMILSKSRQLRSLKIVSLAGENIPNLILKLHPQLAPNAILYNEYGPTEYAIGTTIAKLYDPKEKKIYSMSVGKPLPDTYVYILDENLCSLTDNTKGEIYIGGAGLARGYLNKSELTEEKFISSHARFLYRTGDFGRFLSDGNLEFLGRKDYQVKIRGYRVELGEIEYVIAQYPKINEVVVIVHEKSNSKHLVAYFTSLVQAELQQELKVYLSNLLPNYMIPHSFVQVQSFPRTPNGKIDRQALPDIISSKVKDHTKPQSEFEKILCSIWKKVLKCDEVGIFDNFFDSGGDSLQATIVQTLIEEECKMDISVVDFFHYPTISQLAQYLSNKEKKESIANTPIENQTIKKKRQGALERFRKQHILRIQHESG